MLTRLSRSKIKVKVIARPNQVYDGDSHVDGVVSMAHVSLHLAAVVFKSTAT